MKTLGKYFGLAVGP